MKNNTHISWFSIIEVLVGIFIFTLGLISIYLIMVSSLKLNDYNKNQIIASNLAREQIELIRNVRDTNYNTLFNWDSIPWSSDKITPGNYYKIENDFSGGLPAKINSFVYVDEGQQYLTDMEIFRLCLDDKNRYVFCSSGSNLDTTPFYRYMLVKDTPEAWAYKITSKVMWYKRGYHDLEINTILADWKRL